VPIFKQVKVPTGVVAEFHKVVRVDFIAGTALARATIMSYLTQADFDMEAQPVWSWEIDTSSTVPPGKDINWVMEDRFTNLPSCPFFKGTVLMEPEPLAVAKAQAWQRIKFTRDNREFGGFDWRTYRVESDTESQRRIQYAAQVAQAALVAGTPFSVDWTMADNQHVSLDAANMVDLARALWDHISRQHHNATEARKMINAAQTPEEALAVLWTDYFSPVMYQP
jgi:hypothetical protein